MYCPCGYSLQLKVAENLTSKGKKKKKSEAGETDQEA